MGTIVHMPKNTITRIDKVWMVVSVDPNDNTEGVCASMLGSSMVPLIAADEKRLPWIREQMKLLLDTGAFKHCRLIELHNRTVVEEHSRD